MPALSGLLPLVGCVGGMALCMLLMRRHHGEPTPGSRPNDTAGEVAQLRQDVARLQERLDAERNVPRP